MDICCEIGEQVREIEGVRGLHIMAIGWPAAVPEIVKHLGLYPRPSLGG
jgi:methylenetetrahydrofolate reductase (NADPH)